MKHFLTLQCYAASTSGRSLRIGSVDLLPARKSTEPHMATPAPHRCAKAGKGDNIGVTKIHQRYHLKPNVWRVADPLPAPSGSESHKCCMGMVQIDYGLLPKIRSTGRVSQNWRAYLPYPQFHSRCSRLPSRRTAPSMGDNFLARNENDRGTPSHVALPMILQSNLVGSQKVQRLAAGVRLKVTQPQG